MTPYAVIDVSSWELGGIEPIGLDEKEWLIEPGTGELWLFKPTVTHADGFMQGEDWAEKIVSELGRLLGIPCARIELATRSGRSGCVSGSVKPRGWEMQTGAVLLAEIVVGYRPGSANVNGRPGHSLTNIARALGDLAPPPGASCPEMFTGFDVFAGFLVLDAWAANRDRHDENWSVLRPPPGSTAADALAASYDHASSLGFNLRDAERVRRLADGSTEAYARKGTAWRFEHEPGSRPPTLVRLAADALRLASQGARDYWLERLDAADGSVEARIARVPNMSAPARTFAVRLLEVNRRRLLDEC